MEHVSKDCDCKGRYCKTCEKLLCIGKFYRDRQYLRTSCKVCWTEGTNKHYQENRDQRLAQQKEYRQANAETIQQKNKSYYQENADKVKARVKSYREKNPEIIKQRKAAYRQANLERERAKDRRYHQQNRKRRLEYHKQWRTGHTEYIKTQSEMYRRTHIELIRESRRRYSQQHKERLAQYHQQYYQQNKMLWSYDRPEVRERSRINKHARRARKRSIPGTHTAQQIQEQLKRQHYRCYYAACGHVKFENHKGRYLYHIEHTFPISRMAGTDIPANDISYLVLACPGCNSKKRDKFPWEWPEGGRLL